MMMNILSLLKGKSLKRIINGVFRYAKHSLKKFSLYISSPSKCGISGNENVELIVSLTSFPGRIKQIHLCVKTLLNQSVKPDAVILWLAEEQFPKKENELPKKLLKLQKNGLTIKWCNDIRSYKKLIPTMKEYPDATIITTDDDVYYKKDWLEGLVEAHKQHPQDVCCYRAAKIRIENDEFIREEIAPGVHYDCATYLHQQTGVGGVLYPPHSLSDEVLKEEIFMDIARTNDDLWFWLMGVLNGTKVRMIGGNSFDLYYVGQTQKISLTSIYDHGELLYYKQLNQIFEKYPETLERLKEEYKLIKDKMEK